MPLETEVQVSGWIERVDGRKVYLAGALTLPDGRRIMVATDRQSAFDFVLAAVPYKGQVLNETARFWFEKTADICPNHVIDFPDPNVTVARRLEMLPIECVVRGYLTGSAWKEYRDAGTMHGAPMPAGLQESDRLPEPVFTPATKAAAAQPYRRKCVRSPSRCRSGRCATTSPASRKC
mgnify:CR=1 FL=1